MPERVEADITPAVAVWARTTAGLSAPEAAKLLGVSEDVLGAWEKGLRRPTVPQLRTLADKYKRPVATFFLPAAPSEPALPKDFRKLVDSAPRTLSRELRFEIRRAELRQAAAASLRGETGEAPEVRLPAVSMRTVPEGAAESARKLLGVSLSDQLSWDTAHTALRAWRTAVEGLGILVFHTSRVSLEECRGFSLWEEDAPVVVLNGGDSPRGRVFTLMHEVGHLLLRSAGVCDLHEASKTGSDQLEVWCNAFAAEVLVPSSAFLQRTELGSVDDPASIDRVIESLASAFSVSSEVIARKLLTLSLVSQEFYETKRREYLRRYAEFRSSRPKSKGGPPPYRAVVRANGPAFTRLVLSAYDGENITGSDVSEFLGTKLSHLEAIRHAVLKGDEDTDE